MARPTHLTISTADRIRLDGRCGEDGGDENGENEVRQEVQVSVTYALEAGDTNLVVLAEAKALEVKLAHEAVWDRIGAFSSGNSNAFSSNAFRATNSNGNGSSTGGSPNRCSGRRASDEEADEDRNDEDSDDGNDDPDDDPPGAGLPPDPPPVDPPLGGPVRGSWYMPGGSGNGIASPAPSPASDSPTPDADPITGPQRILIRSRAKKAGLTPYALESLVYQQFRVWKVEKLTKEQAASLLDALERDLKERELKRNDKDGAQGSATAAPVV